MWLEDSKQKQQDRLSKRRAGAGVFRALTETGTSLVFLQCYEEPLKDC